MPRRSFSNSLDVAIFAAVAVVLLSLIALLATNLAFQYFNYRDGITFALADPKVIDHAIVLTYSRAWDFAVAKTSALFLAFLLVFTGALYVLRSAEVRFEASADKGGFKGNLSVSSPGLIMVILGVFLVAFVLSNKTMVEYSREGLTHHPLSKVKAATNTEISPSPSTSTEDIDKRKGKQ